MPKSLLKRTAILVFSIYALYSFVLVSLYHYLAADIVLMDTLWLDAADLLMQWVEVFGISVIFALLISAVYHYGVKPCRNLYLLLFGALAFKYIAAIVSLSVVYGSLDLTYDYSSYLISLLIEVGLAALMVALCHKHATAHFSRNRATLNAAKTLGVDTDTEAPLLPFQMLFDRKNLIQRAVMIGMGIFAALRLAAFIISDIAFSMAGVTFTAADIPVMLVYWVLQIFLPCFLGYLLIIFCVRVFERFHKA